MVSFSPEVPFFRNQVEQDEQSLKEQEDFKQRAVAFYGDYKKGVNVEQIKRSGKIINIGVGEHKGLIIGKPDLLLLNEVLKSLRRFFKEKEIVPEHFTLRELHCCFVDQNMGVQEFVDQPTLQDLMNYLRGKENEIYLDDVSKEAQELCVNFFSNPKNKGITLDTLIQSDQELYEYSTQLRRRTIFSQRNIVVLGQDNNKIILAPVDVE